MSKSGKKSNPQLIQNGLFLCFTTSKNTTDLETLAAVCDVPKQIHKLSAQDRSMRIL